MNIPFFKRKEIPVNQNDIWNATFPDDQTLLNQQIEINNVFDGLAYVMPNPDPVLKKLGWNKDVEAYKELLADPQLYGAIENNRKSGVTKLLTDIANPDSNKDEIEFINQWFDKLRNDGIYDNLMAHALDTPYFGRMVFGTVWDTVDGKYLPTQIVVMPHELCKFDAKGNLMVSQDGAYFDYPKHPAKFIVLRHKSSASNPYGEALLSKCFWNIRFKKDGLKQWAIFVERFSIPTITAKYNPAALAKSFNTSPSSAANLLLSKLSGMARNGTIVFPDGTEIDVLKSQTSGSIDNFERLVRLCDEQNTKLILGHSGATESTSGDKLSNDTTATEVRDSIIQSDKKYPEALFNQLIYWIHQFNFSGTSLPKFNLYAQEDVDFALAERDAIIVPALTLSGLKLSKKYFIENYGFKEDDLDDSPNPTTPPTSNPTANKNEIVKNLGVFHNIDQYPDQTLIDKFAEDSQYNGMPVESMIKHVKNYIESNKDYPTALKNLVKEFPKMKTDELQSYIEKIMFFADIVGRLAVKSELEELNG